MTAATAQPEAPGRLASLRLILSAGLLGGLVDFLYASGLAVLVKHRPFVSPWQGVASGWIGNQAADLGWASAALGIVTHFGIATVMAATYALVATRVEALTRRPWISSVVYGLILYLVMYRVVLPLRFPARFPRWDGMQSVADILVHVGVGLVIALVLARSRRTV